MIVENERMVVESDGAIGELYLDFIREKDFVCIGAKAALAKNQVSVLVADHIACPNDDKLILQFLYNFIDAFRLSGELYHSAAVIFKQPAFLEDDMFEKFMWQRLQSLSDLDAMHYNFDDRVDRDPTSPNFSFSLKEESCFIIGLNPGSSREARRFLYPTLVFNPHMQFERLKALGKYENIKYAVRKRDIARTGQINPMLKDFGVESEVYQYSGREYDNSWKCPLVINHSK